MNKIIDIDNYEKEFDNLILSKKISNETNGKYHIYYCDDYGNIKNVILKIPPLRLLYNYSNQSFNQVNFPLNPPYSKTKTFNKLITILENKLQEQLNKPKLEWITNLKKIKNFKNIKLNYFGKNKVKIISNDIGITDIKDFEFGAQVEIFVHISHLWLKENKVGISYDISHIKYMSLDDMFKELDSEIDSFKKPTMKREERVVNRRNTETIEKKQSIGFMPSLEMLNNQKSKLKSFAKELN